MKKIIQSGLLSIVMIIGLILTGSVGVGFFCTHEINAWENDRDVPESAWELMPELNVGWSLGNSLENQNLSWGYINNGYGGKEGFSQLECRLGNPLTTEEMIKAVADAGFKSIRIPTSFYNHMTETQPKDPANDYSGVPRPGETIDEDWLARIKQVVDWALKYDLYVILNDHHDTGMYLSMEATGLKDGMGWIYADSDSIELQKSRLNNIWRQYADYFKDYDHHLIFQSTGEVVNQERSFNSDDYLDFRAAHDLNQGFIDTVRATGGNNADRFLILETYAASSEPIFVDECFYTSYSDPGNSDKLIYGVHNYSTDTDAQENSFENLYKRAVKYNTPFIVDECGATVLDSLDTRKSVAYKLVEQAEKYGMAVMIWDADKSDAFGLIDREATRDNKELTYLTGTFNQAGNSYEWRAEEIVGELMRAKAETDKLPSESLAAAADDRLQAADFTPLNAGTVDQLYKGGYSATNANASYPTPVYLASSSGFACIRPFVYSKGAHFIAKLSSGITVTIREMDEQGNYIRDKYVTSDGGYYIPSDDAYFSAIMFRSPNGTTLSYEQFRDAVLDGELELHQRGYDYTGYSVYVKDAVLANDDKTVTVTWDKFTGFPSQGGGYQVFRKTGTDGLWEPVSGFLDKDTESFTDASDKGEGTYYYTVRLFVNENDGSGRKLWAGYDSAGSQVIIKDVTPSLYKRLLQNNTMSIPEMTFTFKFTQQNQWDGDDYVSEAAPIDDQIITINSDSDLITYDTYVGNLAGKKLYEGKVENILRNYAPKAQGTYAYLVEEVVPNSPIADVTYTDSQFIMFVEVEDIGNNDFKVKSVTNRLYKDSGGKTINDYSTPPEIFDKKHELIFYNTYGSSGGTTPTGITTNVLPFIIIGGAGVGGLVLYAMFCAKRKKKEVL